MRSLALLALLLPAIVLGDPAGLAGSTTPSYGATSSSTVHRDSKGKIKRSPGAKSSFRKSHPCPSTGKRSGSCPGYEVDHVRPLACGGSDSPSNMQWLTKSANRSKGAAGCRKR